MKKSFTAVAIAALVLTSAAPMVQAAERTSQIHQAGNPNVHQIAQKKKAKSKSAKRKVSSTSQVGGASQA
jgi:hypothetical protein